MATSKRKGAVKKQTARSATRAVKKPKRSKKTASRSETASRPQSRSRAHAKTTGHRRTAQPTQRGKKEEGDEVWKLLLGVAAAGGVGYGVLKHMEAGQQAAAAQQATVRADEASRHAATAATRASKLAIEIAHTANTRIAQLHREAPPPLSFEGCYAAATNGVLICINMNWVLTGIVDPAKEPGSITGRVIGALAHEWYHFLDMARGTRPSHDEELNADAFAGRQLARLGVPPEHFADLLSRFRESPSHPHGELRSRTVTEAHAAERVKMGA